MRIVHLSILGDPRLSDSDGRALVTPGPKALVLLVSLASAPGLRMSRSVLADVIWGDAASTSAARHALRQCLVRLRKQLGDDESILGADDHTVWLNPDLVVVDLNEAQAAIQSGKADLIVRQSQAIRGRFCAGLDIDVSEFDSWLRTQQDKCDRLCAELHRQAASILAERREDDAAIAAARRRIECEPFQDDAHATLIRLCCELGHRQAAAQAHSACHQLFLDELGVSPAPEVDDALTAPIGVRRKLVPVVPSRHDPALAPGNRTAAAFFAGVAVAVVLLQMTGLWQTARAPVTEPREISLWVSAASAAPAQMASDGPYRIYKVNTNKGENGDDDGSTDHAMLYPAGC